MGGLSCRKLSGENLRYAHEARIHVAISYVKKGFPMNDDFKTITDDKRFFYVVGGR